MSNKNKKRRLLFVRHGQRVDRYLNLAYPAVKDWISECFVGGTEYNPMNMELPMFMPRRNPIQAYFDDPPITTTGESCAQLAGNRMAEIGLRIDLAYSSPSLRCIQTCYRILQGYSDLNGKNNVKIRIDAGLYEFCEFTKCSYPTFAEPKFLAERGFPIDVNYKPVVDNKELEGLAFEPYPEFSTRAKLCIDKILQSAGSDVETILIVTHAPTLLTFVREMFKKPFSPNSLEQFALPGNVFNKPAYLATVMLEQKSSSGGWHMSNPQPMPNFEIRANTTFTQSWLNKESY